MEWNIETFSGIVILMVISVKTPANSESWDFPGCGDSRDSLRWGQKLSSLALGFLVVWWIPVKQVVANWFGALEPEYTWKILYEKGDRFL